MPPLLRHRRANLAVAALFVGAPPLATAVAVGTPVAGAADRDRAADTDSRGGALLQVRCTPERPAGPVPAPSSRSACLLAADPAVRVEVVRRVDGTADVDQWAPSVARPGAAEGSARRPASSSAPELSEPAQRSAESGSTGLLALVATVCVVGVSAGAIRAIFAQRATRTVVA